jgi:phage recombination protein Bet
MSVQVKDFDFDAKKDLIKRMFCKGMSDDEFHLFGHVCKHTKLDPFLKQIYAIPRDGKITIQTSIDGLRLIAERTGRYSPGREATYVYDPDKQLASATSYVKKMTLDGTWHEIAATAHFDEYAQRTREGKLTQFWLTKGHIMLAKCAEALALRKAFPAEMGGLYSDDEMQQADNTVIETVKAEITEKKEGVITDEQYFELSDLLAEIDDPVIEGTFAKHAKVANLGDLPVERFEGAKIYLENQLKFKKARRASYEGQTA